MHDVNKNTMNKKTLIGAALFIRECFAQKTTCGGAVQKLESMRKDAEDKCINNIKRHR